MTHRESEVVRQAIQRLYWLSGGAGEAGDVEEIVTNIEIADRLRSLLAGDSICNTCGDPNPCWHAPNDVWNAVVPEISGVLCPKCFIKRAADIYKSWELRPDPVLYPNPPLQREQLNP